VCAVVVDHCRSLLTWCRESDARLARCAWTGGSSVLLIITAMYA
jgi:hypothetical protein